MADELPADPAAATKPGSVSGSAGAGSAAGSLHRLTRSHSSSSMDAAGRDGSLVLLEPSPAATAVHTPIASGSAGAGGAGGAAEEEKGPRPLAFATAGPCRVLYHNPET